VKSKFGLLHGCMVTETSRGRLTLDSGASSLMLYETKGVTWLGERTAHTVEGFATLKYGALSRLRIADREFRNVDVVEAARPKLDESEADGLLPASIFDALYVSNSGGYVVFNPTR
jgi:hypothetical protein